MCDLFEYNITSIKLRGQETELLSRYIPYSLGLILVSAINIGYNTFRKLRLRAKVV